MIILLLLSWQSGTVNDLLLDFHKNTKYLIVEIQLFKCTEKFYYLKITVIMFSFWKKDQHCYLTLPRSQLVGGRSAGRWSWCSWGWFWCSAWRGRRTAGGAAPPWWSRSTCSRRRAEYWGGRWGSTPPTAYSPTGTPPPHGNGCNLPRRSEVPVESWSNICVEQTNRGNRHAQLTTCCDRGLEASQHVGELSRELVVEPIHEYVLHTTVLKQVLQRDARAKRQCRPSYWIITVEITVKRGTV